MKLVTVYILLLHRVFTSCCNAWTYNV